MAKWVGLLLLPLLAQAASIQFNVPAQSAAQALLQFSQQAGVEVLFSFEELSTTESIEVIGTLEVEEALSRLVRNSVFYARRSGPGKFVVTRLARPTGSI